MKNKFLLGVAAVAVVSCFGKTPSQDITELKKANDNLATEVNTLKDEVKEEKAVKDAYTAWNADPYLINTKEEIEKEVALNAAITSLADKGLTALWNQYLAARGKYILSLGIK